MSKKYILSARIPVELKDALETISKETNVSLTDTITYILEKGIGAPSKKELIKKLENELREKNEEKLLLNKKYSLKGLSKEDIGVAWENAHKD